MSVDNAEVTANSNSHEQQKMVNGEQHVNGLSNGHHSDKHKSSSHKSSSKDKHRDKDRSKDHKSSKSSHRDKDRDTEKHSSSNGKSKHSSSSTHKSSHKSKDRDKDREKDKDRENKPKEHKSSSSNHENKTSSSNNEIKSSSSNHENKDRDKSDKQKSSNSSSKDKHSSSNSGSKHKSKDKDKDRSKSSGDPHKSSSSGSKHKSKDKDRSDRDKHKSAGSSSHKDKSSSSSSRHHKESVEVKPEVVDEVDVKEEAKSPLKDFSNNCERLDMSQNSSCDYSLSQFKDEECSLPVKSENETESEENNFVNVKGEPDDDDYENEGNGGVESEEDIPLSKRKKVETDSEDDAPLFSRKRPKTEKKEKKKKRVKEESDDDEDDESDYGKSKKKKAKKETASAPAKKPAAKPVKNEVASPTKGRKKKKEEEEPEVWKWWEEEKKNDGTKWTFLEHKGPMFAPPYDPLPSSVIFEYNGKKIKLCEEAEEIAGFYARLLDHEYTSKVAFNNNFFKDWRKSMNKKEREVINDLHKCNFRHMQAFFTEQSEKNRNRSKEEKLALKEKNEAIIKEYGIAIIDGHKEKIGNFRIEPPGLFRGRGEHPKMGTLKKRITPEDIIINCSKDSNAPQPPKGHRWKEVRHDNTVTWLASWTENVQNQVKYIMLNPSSKIKGEKDYMKYETARCLKKKISKIRDTYMSEWKSKEMRIRQRAVALYFIDKLALRAGNEKDEDQADTVGCCSLRYEHVTLHDDLNGKDNVVVFDFLGKDSIRYYNEVSVEKRVFKNLQLFKENKKEGDDLFDRLNTTMLNEHLKELMDGLTAKVFRTYNASSTLQNQLDELTEEDTTIPEKMLAYNRANRAVAILCNHQRAVPKTHGKSMENIREKIRLKREQIDDCQRDLKDIKRGSAKGAIDKEKKKKQLERLREQLSKLEIQETDKDENKTISLGTSKLNYLDPRISVAWCKKNGVPIEKIFNKTQRDKFRWAIEMVDEDYVF